MKRLLRIALPVVLAVLAGFATFHFMPKPLPELNREAFLVEVREDHVSRIVIEDGVITGVSSKRGPFRTAYDPADTRLAAELRKHRVAVVVDRSEVLTP